MARPDTVIEQVPEAVLLDAFTGLRNNVSRERMAPTDFSRAINIDIDDVGQVRRRRGQTLVQAGSFHSLWNEGSQALVVKDGVLHRVMPGGQLATLGTTVGADPLAYAEVAGVVYFSSESTSGKIVEGVVQSWGASDSAGRWVSPVVLDTATLGRISGRVLKVPPLATMLTHFRGRIYLGAERILWGTELYLYDYVDRNRNYVQFESDLTMVRAVDEGIYVGTESALYFLSGSLASGLTQKKLADHGVVRGSSTLVQASLVRNAGQGLPAEARAVLFLTPAGVCAGMPSGQVINLTQDRVEFPISYSAAALCRTDRGVTAYVAAVDSNGQPSTNARVGDYVDAEIVRAADRGLNQ